MTSLAQITVPFHGAELFIIEHNGQPYTPMKPIVDGMGLDWAAQFTKLKQRFNTCVAEITIQVVGGHQNRSYICLPVRKLFGWLMTISPNKIPNPETRAKVIMYQNECDDVLWDYWTKGQAINKRVTISPEQKDALHKIIDERTSGSVRVRTEMWTRHNRHFNIDSYHELLAVHFEDSKRYLTSMVLKTKVQPEPELLPAPFMTLPTQVGCFLTVCDPDGTTTIYDASNYELVEKGLMEKFHQDWDLAAKAIMQMYTSSFAKVGYRIHEQNNTLPVLKKFVQSK